MRSIRGHSMRSIIDQLREGTRSATQGATSDAGVGMKTSSYSFVPFSWKVAVHAAGTAGGCRPPTSDPVNPPATNVKSKLNVTAMAPSGAVAWQFATKWQEAASSVPGHRPWTAAKTAFQVPSPFFEKLTELAPLLNSFGSHVPEAKVASTL
jgi:hypothetical protein